MNRFASFAATLSLAAFVSGAGLTKPPLQSFTGRLEFLGEFTLFPFDPSGPRARECVSGAFPLRKHRRAQRRYRGKLVTIQGRRAPYVSLVEQVGSTERGWKGTPIPNYCGSEYVILAEKVREVREQKRNEILSVD